MHRTTRFSFHSLPFRLLCPHLRSQLACRAQFSGVGESRREQSRKGTRTHKRESQTLESSSQKTILTRNQRSLWPSGRLWLLDNILHR